MNAIVLPVVILIIASLFGFTQRKVSTQIMSALSSVASLAMVYVGMLGFSKSLELEYRIYASSSLLGSFNHLIFKVDYLSAFFLLILGTLGFCSSLYGIKYMERYSEEDVRSYNFSYPIFLLTMYLVLICWNLLWFVVFWELMTLSSQFLVAFERSDKAVRAAYKYFCMTKAGADFLVLSAVLLLLRATSFNADYSQIMAILPGYLLAHPETLYFLTFTFLVGFGVKAAMIPFHAWLPDAHPEAPSNVSALLSGVMIKLPIYMLFRVFMGFFPRSASIGLIVGIFGVMTLFFAMFYALLQSDSKRLLAFSSIDNIGYILLPMGVGIYFLASGDELFGSIVLAASLFHTINHAFFKGLLFLTAGSVLYETGTRDLNRLGGLAKKMPITAFTALMGSLAIAGIPPMNGFVSKWMMYVPILSSPKISLFGVFAIFISAVTLGAFVKYFTAIFTGSPTQERDAKEVPSLMWAPQMLLALLCMIFGIYPFLPLKFISKAMLPLNVQFSLDKIVLYPSLVLPRDASYSPLILLAFIPLVVLVLLILIPLMIKELSLWRCGGQENLNLKLPAEAYYKDFREVFGEVYKLGTWSTEQVLNLGNVGSRCCSALDFHSYSLNLMLSLSMVFVAALVLLLGGAGL
ncbi:proton-conducting transporter membrane subunit [Thermococcus sp.]|uniref:proton-conducting transporter transmembrane domain-containing protein n=1 Tax=Thermococcus sp. TaxID=35749 RepID=UPI0019BC2AAB|nr:proton-conducting transporter membrane subunit [Thermococcus sp.]MBC7095397.1 hydantoin racemase [Thermococcus sp.]